MPAKKEDHEKDGKSEDDGDADVKPTVEQRVDDAVRDAKVALLKVRRRFAAAELPGRHPIQIPGDVRWQGLE